MVGIPSEFRIERRNPSLYLTTARGATMVFRKQEQKEALIGRGEGVVMARRFWYGWNPLGLPNLTPQSTPDSDHYPWTYNGV